MNLTAEAHVEGLVGTGNQPCGSLVHPAVRQLDLIAVDDALLEESVFVADRETGGGIVERRKGVHEAGGQTSETAVAEPGIRFDLVDFVQILPHGGEGFPVFRLEAEIHEVVLELAAHQKFHAEIIHALRMGLLDPVMDHLPFRGEHLLDGQGRGLEDLLFGGFLGRDAEVACQLGLDARAHRVLVQSSIRIHTLFPGSNKNTGVRAENPDAEETISVLYPVIILLQTAININVSFCRNIP